MIYYALVILAGLVYVGCYAIICWKIGSWINCFSVTFGLTTAIDVVFGYAGIVIYGPSGSLKAYLYTYLTQMGCAIVVMVVVLLLQGPRINWYPRFGITRMRYLPWVIIGLSIVAELPILIQFHQFLLTPRRIYEATRTGFGLNYYASIVLANAGFLLFLFKRNKSRMQTIAFLFAAGFSLFEHGSKGAFLEPLLIYLLYLVHVHRKRIGFITAAGAGSLVMAFVSLMFVATMNIGSPVELFATMTGYADINRNGMMVIDSPMKDAPFLGKIALESELYARMPRAFFPAKPKTYGQFRLAEHYQNAEYSADQGASAFSGIGVLYADFGPFSVIISLLASGLSAYFSIGLIRKLRRSPTPGLFILLCFLNGLSIIPIVIFILPETLAIALIIDVLSSGGSIRIINRIRSWVWSIKHAPRSTGGSLKGAE